jgi:hypothetical protein
MPPTRTATTRSGRKYGLAESLRSSSALQIAVANRARLVVSLCDQRADLPREAPQLSHPVVAEGLSAHADRLSVQTYTTVSRLLRGHRRWTFDLVWALSEWARDVFALHVDPGWIAFGSGSGAPAPEIPADCVLRPDTTLDGLEPSHRTLRQIRASERARRRA